MLTKILLEVTFHDVPFRQCITKVTHVHDVQLQIEIEINYTNSSDEIIEPSWYTVPTSPPNVSHVGEK